MKYRAKKDIPKEIEKWEEIDFIPKGTICECVPWHGIDTICYKGKAICDADSDMEKDYFEVVRECRS